MRNPLAVIIPDPAPAPRGHPLRFGVIKSVHRSAVKAHIAARGLSAPGFVRRLAVEALPGERVRFDHLPEE